MRTNIPIALAFLVLVVLFIFSCSSGNNQKPLDERELRDYPVGDSVNDRDGRMNVH